MKKRGTANKAGNKKSIEQIAAEHLANQAKPISNVPGAADVIRGDRNAR